LRDLPKQEQNENVLIGLDTPDDAGVYKLSDDLALIQTLDFFTPIVDDPYMFGQIAAANSLSDVYAMGGEPMTAMNIIGYPISQLPKEMLAEILRGSADKVKESGAVLIGGHSIDNKEPIVGLSVTGRVHPEKVWANHNAKAGDLLILTKPIGVGIQTTAIKKDLLSDDKLAYVTKVMATLNKYAAEVLRNYPINSATDVTGFGLIGHSLEMAEGSNVGMIIYSQNVPILAGTKELVHKGTVPAGSKDNRKFVGEKAIYAEHLDDADITILNDAVTSGGLLVSVAKQYGEEIIKKLKEIGINEAEIIGEVTDKHIGKIYVI